MTTPLRPQQYHLSWPLTPSQVEGLDAMLETLFKRLRAVDIAASMGASGSGDFDHQMIGNVVGRLPFDVVQGDDGERGFPGITGATGSQGLQGIPGYDGESGEEGPKGAPGTPGSTGVQGPMGVPGIDGENGDDAAAYQLPNVVNAGWTQGSVVFAGLSGRFAQDNANIFWDATNHRLGIGTTTPTAKRLTLGAVTFDTGALTDFACKFTSTYGFVLEAPSDDSMLGIVYNAPTTSFNISPSYNTTGAYRDIRFFCGGGTVLTFKTTGQIGVSTTVNPSALFHISGGSASAGFAPFKINTGILLTSPEAGAFEFVTDDIYWTITTGAARKGIVLNNGSNLTSGKVPIATTNGRLIDSTAALLSAGGVANVVASTFEKAETGTDANVLTYATNASTDEALIVCVMTDVSSFTGTSIVVTVTWKDSNNATATSTLTVSAVGDGSINVPINALKSTNVVVSTVFVGVSTAYNISAFITRLK